MQREPVLGSFDVGLSYGLPVGVVVAGLLALIVNEPDMKLLSWVGIGVAVAVALFVISRQNSDSND